jgi:hypothetical protein
MEILWDKFSPILTFYTAEERNIPGFWQIDTIHHCGQTTVEQYTHALTAIDAAFGWIELRSLLNNAHSWTFNALSDIKNNALFPILEFHSDNGSGCINHTTEIWRTKESLLFTHNRGRRKNNNCFVEQKKS